jgi:aminoglycoside N3'-acetyltransferase
LGHKREDLVRDLRAIGVEEGDCLALGVSLRSIGWVEGGPETVVEALLESVGPEGTIMVPSFTRVFPTPLAGNRRGKGLRQRWDGLIPWEYVFDPQTTPPLTGAIPTAMWRRADSVRSRHPQNSVVAIGRLARFLTEDHDENAAPYLPYSRLGEARGKGLFIGLGGRLVALRHQAQFEAGLMDILPARAGVRYRRADGSIQIYKRRGYACVSVLHRLNPWLEDLGLLRKGRVGEADSIIADAHGTIEELARMLRQDPALNLCSDYRCLFCRELERQRDLFPELDAPALFQRNTLLRTITARLNKMRSRNSEWGERAFKVLAILVERAEGGQS